MMQLEIPRLLLQPIVENAVIHGVEDQLDFAMIHISGEIEGVDAGSELTTMARAWT